MDTEKIASLSQREDDKSFRLRPIRAQDLDLGSREILKDETELIWYPAEVNTSIRPGWFWHESENSQVKPLSRLIDIYLNSVGGNATFLLNIPPDRRGLFHETDVERLRELGAFLNNNFTHNLLPEAEQLSAPDPEEGHELCRIASEDDQYYYPACHTCLPEISARWSKVQTIRYAVIREHLQLSQRIEQFELWAEKNGRMVCLHRGTTVGYKRIVKLENCHADFILLRITDSRGTPAIEQLAFF